MKQFFKRLSMYLIFFSILTFLVTTPVFAASSEIDLCTDVGVLKAFRIIGIILKIISVVVPIILIGVTIISISKTILSGDSSDFSKHASTFVKRFIAAAVIFFVPMLFDFIFNTLVNNDTSKYKACTVCLFDTGNCKISEEKTSE